MGVFLFKKLIFLISKKTTVPNELRDVDLNNQVKDQLAGSHGINF
jgi:hypothetical protein